MTDDMPPTLAEYAAAAGNPSSGLMCPNCGCRDLRFSYKTDIPSGRQIVKRCRHCNTRVRTSETIERVLPPTPADKRKFAKAKKNAPDDGEDNRHYGVVG